MSDLDFDNKIDVIQEVAKLRTALAECVEALEWKINGFTLREYLHIQFPATIGHFPIEGHLDRLDEALATARLLVGSSHENIPCPGCAGSSTDHSEFCVAARTLIGALGEKDGGK